MNDSVLIAIIGGAASVITMLVKHYLEKGNSNLKDINNSLNEIKVLAQKTADGTKTISRYRLLKDMSRIINRGYISTKELEEITELYHSYRRLGGNSTVSEIYSMIKNLPIKNGVTDFYDR